MTMHRVQKGQRLSEIAASYGISTDEIVRANPTKEAVTLASGAQVFASLADGEDIELPGVLGAAQSDYPRRFYEQAFDALHATLSMDLKSQEILDKVAQAAAYMKSATTYLETHTLTSSKYKSQLDAIVYAKGIALNIDTLDAILTGKAIFHEPGNYYALLADTLGRLGGEMDKWPKPAAASFGDLIFPKTAWAAQKPLPSTGTFPGGNAAQGTSTKVQTDVTWGGPIKVDLDAEALCAAKGARLNRMTGKCDSADGTSTDPFAATDTAPVVTAASCAAKGMVFDVTTKACVPAPDTCPAGTWWKQETQSCVPNASQASPPPRGDGCPAGTWWKQETQSCVPNASQASPPPRGDGGKQAAPAASSTTKKVLIVAGSVLALGLAGFGAWHMLAKDKPAEKPAP